MDQARQTKLDTVMGTIRAQIANGALQPGDRLRSIREQSRVMGVAKNTVIEAYMRLVAQGALQSRPGAGYYVSQGMPVPARAEPRPFKGIPDGRALLIEQLERRLPIRPGDGRLPADWLADAEMRRALGRQRNHSPEAYNYNVIRGFMALRERLSGVLADRGVACSADQIVTTHGANHALDLIIRAYVKPDMAVMVDEPGYYPLFLKLNLAGARIVGVRRDADGPDVADFARAARETGARMFFTQSLAHNPTGGSITLPRAHALLKAAEAHDVLVVEDDAFADIIPDATPRLATLDGFDRLIYIGTFSKTLAGSFRSGYLAASPDRAEALAELLMVSDISTSSHNERLIHALMEDASYHKHLRRLTARIGEAHDTTCTMLARLGVETAPAPVPGIYVWATLPVRDSHAELVADAAAKGIFIAPSQAFRLGNAPELSLRINVAYANDPKFIQWLGTLRDRQG